MVISITIFSTCFLFKAKDSVADKSKFLLGTRASCMYDDVCWSLIIYFKNDKIWMSCPVKHFIKRRWIFLLPYHIPVHLSCVFGLCFTGHVEWTFVTLSLSQHQRIYQCIERTFRCRPCSLIIHIVGCRRERTSLLRGLLFPYKS